eukprot:gene9931-biopygen9291
MVRIINGLENEACTWQRPEICVRISNENELSVLGGVAYTRGGGAGTTLPYHTTIGPRGNRTLARAWHGHGAGVARAIGNFAPWVTRVWRGHVLFPKQEPYGGAGAAVPRNTRRRPCPTKSGPGPGLFPGGAPFPPSPLSPFRGVHRCSL